MDILGEKLVRRDCVSCPAEPPTCNCGKGEVCTLTVKTCTHCPEARCISDGSTTSNSSNYASAIAGGVVGGLVGLGIILGILLWRKVRHRRKRHLQALNEVALEFDSPNSPEIDASSPEAKPPSIISTYGGASRRSNVIPILFPFNVDTQGQFGPHTQVLNNDYPELQPRNGGEIPMHSGANGSRITLDGQNSQPVIRDSIRDSEYSLQSENRIFADNQGLRAYDIAVQGLPSLVDMSKQKSSVKAPSNLGRISETDAISVTSTQQTAPSSKRRSMVSARSRPRQSHRNSYAALPDLPTGQRQERHLTRSSKITEPDNSPEQGTSPFDDSQSINETHSPANARQSQTSSNIYIADLPAEAKLYQGHGLL